MSRYILDNSRPVKLFKCPACNKKRLKLYVDEEGNYLADWVGRCNREVKCGYHYPPRQLFQEYPDFLTNQHPAPMITPNANRATISYIPQEFFVKSLQANLPNNLLTFIESLVGPDHLEAVRQRFKIGHSKHWDGATTLWYIDEKEKVRAGKVMLFDKATGKRVKKPFNHIDWVHSILLKKKILTEFHLSQCLFGLHQLANYNVNHIGIVESEKSAVCSSLFLPDLTWMATGGLSMLSPERLLPIKKFPIVLYPDLGAFEKWKEKADALTSNGFKVAISDLLEKASFVTLSDRENGFDIWDYLLRINQNKRPQEHDFAGNEIDQGKGYPESWNINVENLNPTV